MKGITSIQVYHKINRKFLSGGHWLVLLHGVMSVVMHIALCNYLVCTFLCKKCTVSVLFSLFFN